MNIRTDDPQFVDPASGDFRLQPTSPAIDAGAVTDEVTAGTDIILLLFDDQSFVRNFGVFSSPAGAARSQILLPLSLRSADAYLIKAISFLDGDLTSSTPPLTIQSVPHNALPARDWTRY